MKVVVLVTKEGQKQADKTVNLTVGKMERNLDNQLRIGKELTRDTTLG